MKVILLYIYIYLKRLPCREHTHFRPLGWSTTPSQGTMTREPHFRDYTLLGPMVYEEWYTADIFRWKMLHLKYKKSYNKCFFCYYRVIPYQIEHLNKKKSRNPKLFKVPLSNLCKWCCEKSHLHWHTHNYGKNLPFILWSILWFCIFFTKKCQVLKLFSICKRLKVHIII